MNILLTPTQKNILKAMLANGKEGDLSDHAQEDVVALMKAKMLDLAVCKRDRHNIRLLKLGIAAAKADK